MRRQLPHDLTNALAAAARCSSRAWRPLDGVATGAGLLRRAPHRIELVGAIAGGVATTTTRRPPRPTPRVTAVRAFEHVVLIAGGRNKGLDLTRAGRRARADAGRGGHRRGGAGGGRRVRRRAARSRRATSMDEAVRAGPRARPRRRRRAAVAGVRQLRLVRRLRRAGRRLRPRRPRTGRGRAEPTSAPAPDRPGSSRRPHAGTDAAGAVGPRSPRRARHPQPPADAPARRRGRRPPPPLQFYLLAVSSRSSSLLGLVMVLSASSVTALHADGSAGRTSCSRPCGRCSASVALLVTCGCRTTSGAGSSRWPCSASFAPDGRGARARHRRDGERGAGVVPLRLRSPSSRPSC